MITFRDMVEGMNEVPTIGAASAKAFIADLKGEFRDKYDEIIEAIDCGYDNSIFTDIAMMPITPEERGKFILRECDRVIALAVEGFISDLMSEYELEDSGFYHRIQWDPWA